MELFHDRAAAVSKNKSSRLARTFAKVLHLRAVSGIAPDDDNGGKHSKVKKSGEIVKQKYLQSSEDEDGNKLCDRAAIEAFLAKLFASLSAIKAAYAQLQFAQSPYDPDGIQSADEMVVSELKNLSELKQCYLKKQLDEYSSSPHETTQILAEIQEQKSLLKTYEITVKKLDSQLKLKDSEITFLKEKLEEIHRENKSLQERTSWRLNASGDNLDLRLKPTTHFITFLHQTVKSVRSFVGLLIREMEKSAEWDLDAAVNSIEPDVVFWKSSHKCYAFESFVCREMFDGFNHPEFTISGESLFISEENKRRQQVFFDRFMELRSVKAMDYLAWKPKSPFANYCRAKYLRLIHPRLETSLFGNTDQRNLIINAAAGEFPETSTFFVTFTEMAKRIWMLQCLAFSFNQQVTIFQVSKGSRFSEVYMESINDEAFMSPAEPRVGFTVVPGFRIGKTAVQCQVYLC